MVWIFFWKSGASSSRGGRNGAVWSILKAAEGEEVWHARVMGGPMSPSGVTRRVVVDRAAIVWAHGWASQRVWARPSLRATARRRTVSAAPPRALFGGNGARRRRGRA